MSVEAPLDLYRRAVDASKLAISDAVDSGSSGGAYVLLTNSRSSFVRSLKQAGIGSKGSPGWIISPNVPREIQNVEVHRNAAESMASVLEEAGIKTYVKSWMD